MIVYFLKKSKIIVRVLILLSFLFIGLYSLFVWGQILKKQSSTIQILQSSMSRVLPIQSTIDTKKQNTIINLKENEYLFVASSRGKYYYPKTCNRAKSLSPKNMLYFKDKITAEQAGYVAHSEC
jgi:hypothetical protein